MNKILFSSVNNDWNTPQELFDKLNEKFNFTLDPCANDLNHKCKKYFTIKEHGLIKNWEGETVFCNPPYGKEIYKWVKKCYEESLKPNTTIVLLIPSRTDTKYFHEFLYNKPNIKLHFIKGRLKFGNSSNSAPFPSLIAIFRKELKTEIPKSIKNLSREQLEEFCINLMDSEHKFCHRANDIEECIKEIEKYCKYGIKNYITDDGFVEEVLKDLLKIIDKYRKWFDEN